MGKSNLIPSLNAVYFLFGDVLAISENWSCI